jgi:DNA-binding response OmpR family regulator
MGSLLTLQVLLVEDDQDLGRMVSKRLEAVGYADIEVHWKQTLQAAVDFVQAARPSVVLLDLGLPDSTGLNSFFRLHETQPEVPIVIISANDDRDTVVQALREGAQDYIVKGKMDPVTLTALMIKAIERHARERAEYHERKRVLKRAMNALRETKHQTQREAQETVVEVMGAVLSIMSGEGDPVDD